MSPFGLHVMALTIRAEAEGEPLEGLHGVGWVIRSRFEKKFFGWKNGIAAICLMPKQFSCWNDDYRRRLTGLFDLDNTLYEYVALGIMSGQIPDPTNDADHYFADYITPPAWADESKFTVQIGRHKFYRLRG